MPGCGCRSGFKGFLKEPRSPFDSSAAMLSRRLIFLLLAAYALWVIYPMIWVAYSSLKDDAAIYRDAFALPPLDDLRTGNYVQAWRDARFGDYLFNSLW